MFNIKIPYFDIEAIIGTQMYLRINSKGKGVYDVISGNKKVQVKQSKEQFSFMCSQEDFFNLWYDTLDIGFDNQDVIPSKLIKDEIYFNRLSNKSKGTRLLNIDDNQTILECILLSNAKSFIDAKIAMDDICEQCGKKRTSAYGDWRETPDIKVLYKKLSWLDDGNLEKTIKEISKEIKKLEFDLNENKDFYYMNCLSLCDWLSDNGYINYQWSVILMVRLMGDKTKFPITRQLRNILSEELDLETKEQIQNYFNGVKYKVPLFMMMLSDDNRFGKARKTRWE